MPKRRDIIIQGGTNGSQRSIAPTAGVRLHTRGPCRADLHAFVRDGRRSGSDTDGAKARQQRCGQSGRSRRGSDRHRPETRGIGAEGAGRDHRLHRSAQVGRRPQRQRPAWPIRPTCASTSTPSAAEQPTSPSAASVPHVWTTTRSIRRSASQVDGIYLGTLVGQLIDNFDLQRIEVLRGPQGTLFGRNTIGGALNVIRTEPTGEWGAKVSYTTGSWNDQEFRGVFNAPLIKDVLALKLYLFTANRDGYLHNTYLNINQPQRDYKNFGGSSEVHAQRQVQGGVHLRQIRRSQPGRRLPDQLQHGGRRPWPRRKTPSDINAPGPTAIRTPTPAPPALRCSAPAERNWPPSCRVSSV